MKKKTVIPQVDIPESNPKDLISIFKRSAVDELRLKEDKEIFTIMASCSGTVHRDEDETSPPPTKEVKCSPTTMKELLGERIVSLRISNDQTILVFSSNKRNHIYEAWGDCCSETWFADVVGVGELIGSVVKRVEEIQFVSVGEKLPLSYTGISIEYNLDDGRCRQESDTVYGYRIFTSKGQCDIIFRNSSNGYYGGDIHYVQYIRGLPELYGFKQITEDWSA